MRCDVEMIKNNKIDIAVPSRVYKYLIFSLTVSKIGYDKYEWGAFKIRVNAFLTHK
jgi:hypothetical protein